MLQGVARPAKAGVERFSQSRCARAGGEAGVGIEKQAPELTPGATPAVGGETAALDDERLQPN